VGSTGIGASVFLSGESAGSVATLLGGSVFADAGQQSVTLSSGASGQSDLPFMHDAGAGDPAVYSTSTETSWVFVSDFGGDGWFFA
jgi:hypothetical protein